MIEERRKKAEEQEDKRQAPLTDRQIAVLKNELVNHMNVSSDVPAVLAVCWLVWLSSAAWMLGYED